MREKALLGDTHGVDLARAAIIIVAAIMGVAVRPDDVDAARTDAGAGARPHDIIVVPALHILDGMAVLVAIIGGRILVEGRGEIVLIGAGGFVAAIFHRPHRMLRALVDIHHLAAIFGDFAVQHFARSDGAAAMGIVLIADRLHLRHMRFADILVPAFVEEDRGIVAIIDDRVAHHLLALVPAAAGDVAFGVARRHRLHQADAVGGFDVLLGRGDVHPADQIAAALHHQRVGKVADPGRDGGADGGPFIGGALGIAMDHDGAAVEVDLAIAEAGLAEAGPGVDAVDHLALVHQAGRDGVEIAIAPAPIMEAGDRCGGGEGSALAGRNRGGGAVEAGNAAAGGIAHFDAERQGAGGGAVVADLAFGMDGRAAAGDVETVGPDILAGGAERRIERQRLIDRAGQVEPDILGNAAIIDVEIVIVPLEAAAGGAFLIFPVIVDAHGDDIVAGFERSRNIGAKGHHAMFG